MIRDERMSKKLEWLFSHGLIQPWPTADFRMPTARVYVPLLTEYSTFDSPTPFEGRDDAQLDRRTPGNSFPVITSLDMMTYPIVVKGENIEYDDVHHSDDEGTMKDQWAEHAKNVLKAELKRRNVSYRELAERLTAMGSPESERNLANKISRGGFTASFLLQALRAVGCDDLRIDHLPQADHAR